MQWAGWKSSNARLEHWILWLICMILEKGRRGLFKITARVYFSYKWDCTTCSPKSRDVKTGMLCIVAGVSHLKRPFFFLPWSESLILHIVVSRILRTISNDHSTFHYIFKMSNSNPNNKRMNASRSQLIKSAVCQRLSSWMWYEIRNIHLCIWAVIFFFPSLSLLCSK